MTNLTSIKYISSLLGNPASVNDGDQSSISLFRQTFPYFVPIRYISALEEHRKQPFAPGMLSAVHPYLCDWIMFCDFLNAGAVAGAAGNRPGDGVPPLREKAGAAAVAQPPAPEARATPVVPPAPVQPTLEEELQSLGPIFAVVETGPGTFAPPPTAAPFTDSQKEKAVRPAQEEVRKEPDEAHKAPPPEVAAPVAEEQEKEEISDMQAPVAPPQNAETEHPVSYAPPAEQASPVVPAAVTIPDEPNPESLEALPGNTPVYLASDEEAAAAVHEEVADETYAPIPTPVAIPDEEPQVTAAQQEPKEVAPIPMPVQIPTEDKLQYTPPEGDRERPLVELIIDEAITDEEVTVAYAEPVSVTADVPEDGEPEEAIALAYEDSGMAAMEEPAESPILSADEDALFIEITEILPEDEQGHEPVHSGDVPGEATVAEAGATTEAIAGGVEIMNEAGAEAKHTATGRKEYDPLIFPIYTKDYFLQQGEKISDELPLEINELRENGGDEDKSLMVVMSFAEWLQHFKHSSEKQREETKDQKALKTMWQKEKLAAAIEEENEEIPETVFAMAVSSITREEGLMSETLAEIYMKQGKHDKAIDMYRKLSLTNPQKSAYFAVKIDEALKDKEL